ncbi:hypothetical protein [Erythrobacter mangrovi]|uniref:Uncharacterized protein n=1 Tax=Erythrobacter mangrovi TaxID=2739433 RepID=A0A7D4B6B0_9SPHN|nr:hypothetical protein [Erythrobacter mangrovi]QKG70203.1 hypothetical protein HQR01_01790 [Erythrobacter mangrovi]
MQRSMIMAGAAALALSACGGSQASDDTGASSTPVEDVAVIPEALAPFGDGYPNPGDACRRLGESEATSNFLDDSATLVGCPSEAAAEALGGTVIGNIDGVRLVSIPMGNANVGMTLPVDAPSEDALVPGTDYNATAQIRCGFKNAKPSQSCDAGVKRKWGEDGTTLVEVQKPDGFKRAIFFKGTEPYGADSAQSDGSAGWTFTSTRSGDEVTIRFGPETYVIVDAFVEGG